MHSKTPADGELPLPLSQAFPDLVGLRERDGRLEALKALVAELTHDFNNLLVPVVGYVTLLKEEVKPNPPAGNYLLKLDNSVRKTESLIEVLLQATHPERQHSPKRVDFTALLQQTTENWLKALPPSVEIGLEISLGPCELWLDEQQWTKVILSLLRNAQTAVGDHGAVRISLAPRALTEDQTAGLELGDTDVYELAIEDNGCGMSEEVLKRSCDPLFTTRPGRATAGLGLTLVHSVVRLHGGQLSIDSVEAAGTRVRIWLPANGG
jgi:signal transduction histidine kinase